MLKKWIKTILFTAVLLPAAVFAATVSGQVKDLKTNNALAYANAALKSIESGEVITGAMTDEDGYYHIINVAKGNYTLVVSFMGYDTKTVPSVIVSSADVKIPSVMLKPQALKMGAVEVTAEKPALSYKIDKRVIDASQFLSARGGTAVEILENVPSVDVDIEGNVSVRGSENFTVMIDGRPTVLESQDALESVPASSIENIEIMTNASAKFEAEGGAGIINIVTKRDKRIGITGLASVNAGTNNLGGNLLLNYTNKKITAYISADYNKRNFTGESYVNRNLYYNADTTSNFISEGDRMFQRDGWGVRGGLDYFISKKDVMGVSFNYGPRGMRSSSITDYTVNYLDPNSDAIYSTQNYTSYENSTRGGNKYSVLMDYTHTFKDKTLKEVDATSKGAGQGPGGGGHGGGPGGMSANGEKKSSGHKLKMEVSYSNSEMDEDGYTYLVDALGDTTEAQRTTETGPSNHVRSKIEYVLPLSLTSTFETGADARFNWKSDLNDVYYYDPASGEFEQQDLYSNNAVYTQNTFSGYAMASAEFGLLGIQPGVRAEYTYREISSEVTDSTYVVDRLNIFPTLHMSYQLPAYVQLMASYTRRISRPRGWQLEPFYSWQDAYNIRVGNPALEPEMTDSYEMSVQKSFGKSFVSMDAFYKHTTDKIERIESVYSDDVVLSTYENVGTDQSLGLEVMANLNLFTWWTLNASGSVYQYEVEGELYGEDFSESSLNYMTRLRNTLMMPFGTRLQLGLAYRSASATAQGSSSGGLMTDLGLRQDFFDNKLSATVQVRDVFGTGFRQSESTTPSSYTYSEFYRDAPMFSLDLSFKINNYKNQKTESSNFDSDNFNSENSSEF